MIYENFASTININILKWDNLEENEFLDSLLNFPHFLPPICFCSTKIERVAPGVGSQYQYH